MTALWITLGIVGGIAIAIGLMHIVVALAVAKGLNW